VRKPKWVFIRIRDRGDRTVDPSEGLFFEKLPPLGAVIRESAQNSLDALLEGSDEPVRMRFSIHTKGFSMERGKADYYLHSLLEHLRASGMKGLPGDDEEMAFFVIEDFGTVGLIGDPRVYFDSEDEDLQANRFYWFHRNTNRTQAEKKRGGSFGYGKASFALASKLGSFFTVSRGADGKIKVFGNSIAKTHEIGGHRYKPYGDYGFVEEDDEEGVGIVPSEESEFYSQICSDFDLSRGVEPGLSVIIPFPKQMYNSNEILESVIRNYFLPICQGRLVVEVCENGDCVTVDSASIATITDRLDWLGEVPGAMTSTNRRCMAGMVDLASWWAGGASITDLDLPTEGQPFWYKDLISEDSFDALSEKLEGGERIAVRVKMKIAMKTDNGRKERYPKKSSFTVLLLKDEAFGGSDAVWIRRYLSVPKKDFTPKKGGYIAIVISEDGPLEELLRASEEVAHTEHRPQRVAGEYMYASKVIAFFRKSAAHLVEFLSHRELLLQDHWLDDWFPSEEVEPDRPDKPKKRRRKKKDELDDDEGKPTGPDPPPEDLSRHHSWDLKKSPGGFSVVGEVNHALDFVFKVTVGYARDDGGDPLKKWKRFDFDLDSSTISIDVEGATVEEVDGNVLTFRVEGPTENYSVRVNGFDTDRDIRVHARPRMEAREDDK